MADTIIAFPKYGVSNGESVPVKAVDLMDGTYAIASSEGTASGVTVAFPLSGGFGGQVVPVATVLLSPGLYALKIES